MKQEDQMLVTHSRSPIHRWFLALLPAVLIVTAFGLWPLSPAHAQAAVVYVAPTGSDGNDGLTLGTPKLTIGAGLTAVDPGGTVMVAAGTYPEAVSITKIGVT